MGHSPAIAREACKTSNLAGKGFPLFEQPCMAKAARQQDDTRSPWRVALEKSRNGRKLIQLVRNTGFTRKTMEDNNYGIN
jgi:hypothetical protein